MFVCYFVDPHVAVEKEEPTEQGKIDFGGLGTCFTLANALLCLDYWIL